MSEPPPAPPPEPIPMILACPVCHERHIDVGEFAKKSHHTHACQSCGTVWRPAIVPTCGVRFLPGFKNPDPNTNPEFYRNPEGLVSGRNA